jgi:single-stranded-DNA-specific exonuclease
MATTTSPAPTASNGPAARWVIPPHDDAAAASLAAALDLPLPIARLLHCRGLTTPEAAHAYLNPALEQMHDPLLMLGMDAAVARIRASLAAAEPILIYGDYDVDGTVATVLLKTAMARTAAALGVPPDVRYHIPHRIREGYGITESRLELAAAEGVRLVVSVDTGIRAFAAALEADRLGLDLIVTDHHLPDAAVGVPHAVAVINPNQPGCPYPYKDLCGAAVAYKLAQALLESVAATPTDRDRLRLKTLPSFLKLLAIATIADAVPLTGENRVIATLGLIELRKPSQSGLRSLMDLAEIDTAKPISATDIGFRLAPRINAAGRMDIASDVVELFLSQDTAAARILAEKLHRLNQDRRDVEARALLDIEARIEDLRATPAGLAPCLVFDDPAWHRGVIGILASRVVDRTGHPALVLSHEDGQAFGSGRSVPGFHLLDALTAVDAAHTDRLFTRFGGHAHAVGFSLPSGSVADLRLRMEAEALRLLSGEPLTADLECHGELHLADLTPSFLAWLERLGPFGNGNPEPLFVSHDLRLTAAPRVIKDRHLRLSVEDPATGARFAGMAWTRRTNWAEQAAAWGLAAGSRIDLAFRLHKNTHPDFGGWEFQAVALRPSAPPAPHS